MPKCEACGAEFAEGEEHTCAKPEEGGGEATAKGGDQPAEGGGEQKTE